MAQEPRKPAVSKKKGQSREEKLLATAAHNLLFWAENFAQAQALRRAGHREAAHGYFEAADRHLDQAMKFAQSAYNARQAARRKDEK